MSWAWHRTVWLLQCSLTRPDLSNKLSQSPFDSFLVCDGGSKIYKKKVVNPVFNRIGRSTETHPTLDSPTYLPKGAGLRVELRSTESCPKNCTTAKISVGDYLKLAVLTFILICMWFRLGLLFLVLNVRFNIRITLIVVIFTILYLILSFLIDKL